jgi:hypothetical protein
MYDIPSAHFVHFRNKNPKILIYAKIKKCMQKINVRTCSESFVFSGKRRVTLTVTLRDMT